ncbi:MAG: hypothetical protein AAGI52_06100 [Bacteroidota bacterium]
MSALASLLLGAALGAAHALMGVLTARLAEGKSYQVFAVIALGGTLFRMLVVLAIVVGIYLLAPVEIAPFLGGLGVTFVVGLAAEVLLLLRRSPRASASETGAVATSA